MKSSGVDAGQVRAQDEAARLRAFGPAGLVAILVILLGAMLGPPVAALLVLLWARVSRTPWRDLGFRAPRRWPLALCGAVTFGVVLKLGLKALVMPLLGAPATNPTYHYLAGNPAALSRMLAVVLISAGFGEEVFFRGYLFERLGKLLGQSKVALVIIVLISSTLFALAHFRTQRLLGVEQATMTGLVFGSVYAWRKQLWIVMIMHAAFDLSAVALIFWNWETAVAHFVFP